MPEPPSARADRARSSMSKTRARRQAHRESYIRRGFGRNEWYFGRPDRMFPRATAESGPYSRLDASRALTAWRAARVRELISGE